MHGGVLDEPLLHWLGKTWVCCKLCLESVGTVGLGCGEIGFVVWSSLNHGGFSPSCEHVN